MLIQPIARESVLSSTSRPEAAPIVVAVDAIQREGLGAWSAVFADGRRATGAAPAACSTEADVRSAMLAAEIAGNGPHLCLITNSDPVLGAVSGQGRLTQWAIWAEFLDTLPCRHQWPTIRRQISTVERRLHRSAHHLADAAWWAAKQGGDPAQVAQNGWADPDTMGGAARIIRSRFGLGLRLPVPLPASMDYALWYAKARLAEIAELAAIEPTHLVVRPNSGKTRAAFEILSELASEINDATSPANFNEHTAASDR